MSANAKRNATLSALAAQSPDELLAAERAAHAVTKAKLEEAERRIVELEDKLVAFGADEPLTPPEAMRCPACETDDCYCVECGAPCSERCVGATGAEDDDDHDYVSRREQKGRR